MANMFSSDFDSGNGVLDAYEGGVFYIKISNDNPTELEKTIHKQWFHFRLSGVRNIDCKIVIANAGDCAFPSAWPGYQVCASYNRSDWFRISTEYCADKGHLVWDCKPKFSQIYFAYFPPFDRERHLDLIASCGFKGAEIRTLCKSIKGVDIDCVVAGHGKRKVWMIARQHPGESMGEWFVQGFLNRLLSSNDPIARFFLEDSTVFVVPNINPDGSSAGFLRTNAAGSNLNREWNNTGNYIAPTIERSPEVLAVLEACKTEGCDFFLDVHGDEELPYNFISGIEGCHVWGERLEKLQNDFCVSLMKSYPNFQMTHGYEKDEPLKANYAMCSNKIAQEFDCLALTLEMPFKNCIDSRGHQVTFLNKDAELFGACCLDAISHVLHSLRDD